MSRLAGEVRWTAADVRAVLLLLLHSSLHFCVATSARRRPKLAGREKVEELPDLVQWRNTSDLSHCNPCRPCRLQTVHLTGMYCIHGRKTDLPSIPPSRPCATANCNLPGRRRGLQGHFGHLPSVPINGSADGKA
jgi:hypothetical protein